MHPEGTHLCGPAARGARGGRGGREARPFHWVPAATRPASPVHPSLLCRRGSRGHRSAPELGSLEAEETLTVTRRQQVSGEHHWLPSPSGERAADHRWARAALTEKRHQLVARTCSWARAPCEGPARRRGSQCRLSQPRIPSRSDRGRSPSAQRGKAQKRRSAEQTWWELGRNQLRRSQDEEAALGKSAMPRRRAERVRAGKLGHPEFCGDKIAGACDSPGGSKRSARDPAVQAAVGKRLRLQRVNSQPPRGARGGDPEELAWARALRKDGWTRTPAVNLSPSEPQEAGRPGPPQSAEGRRGRLKTDKARAA